MRARAAASRRADVCRRETCCHIVARVRVNVAVVVVDVNSDAGAFGNLREFPDRDLSLTQQTRRVTGAEHMFLFFFFSLPFFFFCETSSNTHPRSRHSFLKTFRSIFAICPRGHRFFVCSTILLCYQNGKKVTDVLLYICALNISRAHTHTHTSGRSIAKLGSLCI